MSGTIVASPMVLGPSLFEMAMPFMTGIAVTGAGVGLALSVKQIIDMQAQAAVAHQLKEREKLAAWVTHQHQQIQRMLGLEKTEQAFQESESRLAALELHAPALASAATASRGPQDPSAKSYLSIGKERETPEQIAALFGDLRQLTAGLPDSFRAAKDGACARIALQTKAIEDRIAQGAPVFLEELTMLHQTIGRTFAEYKKELAAQRAQLEASARRLEHCLNEILFYEHFASAPELEMNAERENLGELKNRVAALLAADSISVGAVEVIEKALSAVKAAIDRQVVRAAYQEQIPISLRAQLVAMGYEVIEDFADSGTMRAATLRIPGGEQLQVALHRNGQMAFEVVHERSAMAAGDVGMSAEETAFLMRQEGRWCKDFKELIRRLAAEGFPFVVNFEQAIPATSVKVVVVETPDEILASDHRDRYDGGAVKQYLG